MRGQMPGPKPRFHPTIQFHFEDDQAGPHLCPSSSPALLAQVSRRERTGCPWAWRSLCPDIGMAWRNAPRQGEIPLEVESFIKGDPSGCVLMSVATIRAVGAGVVSAVGW